MSDVDDKYFTNAWLQSLEQSLLLGNKIGRENVELLFKHIYSLEKKLNKAINQRNVLIDNKCKNKFSVYAMYVDQQDQELRELK